MAFTTPQPGEAEIGRYYGSADYAPLSPEAPGWVHRLSRAVRRLRLPVKRRFVERVAGRKTGRLLDIGCGTGEFPAAMRRAGWTVAAIEPDAKGRERTRQKGVDVRDPAALADVPGASFDVVMLWHVLEHTHDPRAMLAEVKRLLSPGGVGIIAVPNRCCLDAEIYGGHWYGYDVPRHLWHFSPGVLERCIASAGLRVVSLHRLLLDPFYICIRSEQISGGDALRGTVNAVRAIRESLRDLRRSSCVIAVVRAA